MTTSVQSSLVPRAYAGKIVAAPLKALPAADRGSKLRLAKVTTLEMQDRFIEVVADGTFEAFPALTTLHLDRNRLTSTDGIDSPCTLRALHLSGNAIASLELGPLRNLETLDLSRNALTSLDAVLDSLVPLSRCLRTLLLAGNPAAEEPAYRLRLLARIPTLAMLDNILVREAEVREARLRYGDLAAGAARIAADAVRLEATLTARTVAAARASTSAAPPKLSASLSAGFGRSGTSVVTNGPAIRFGLGPHADTSTAAATKREVARIGVAKQSAQTAALKAEFDGSAARAGWGGELADASTGMLAGAPAPFVQSALINLHSPWSTEDLQTRSTRLGMLSRNVEPDLLRLDRMGGVGAHGTSSAEAKGRTDPTVAMRNSLAPVVGAWKATHPLPVAGRESTPAADMGASHAFESSSSMSSTHPALHAMLTAKFAGVQGSRCSEQQLLQSELSRSGVRFGSNVLARRPPTGRPPHPGGLMFEGVPLPSSVPDLPTLRADGHLGAWDVWKMSQIFKEADTDGSGDLTKNEIKQCLTATSDYGFCLDLDRALGSTALLGMAATLARGNGAATQRVHDALDSAMEGIFDALDENSSGSITWLELLDALQRDGPQPILPTSRQEKTRKDGPGVLRTRTSVRFRCLRADEAALRAAHYWTIASSAYSLLQAYPTNDSHREKNMARLHADMVAASVKGNRLDSIADALGGSHDPPPRDAPMPSSAPPGRTDFVRSLNVRL
jgi:hypothetical protein